MIGQKYLLDRIKKQIEDKAFPHFCILVGAEGSGKKTLAKEVAKLIKGAVVIENDIAVSDIRSMISNAYKMVGTTVNIIGDADKMSTEAKNALLKVTEEPPNNAYFIMTLCDLSSTLDTIKSRATAYTMDNYSVEEIDTYYQSIAEDNKNAQERSIISDICETPGEVDIMNAQGILSFYDYVELVVDNIAEVSGANSFKIADKLALKADGGGYDLKMFLKVFMSICIRRMDSDPMKYSGGVSVTSKYLRELGIRGVNKQMLFDAWILEIREIW